MRWLIGSGEDGEDEEDSKPKMLLFVFSFFFSLFIFFVGRRGRTTVRGLVKHGGGNRPKPSCLWFCLSATR